MDNIIRELGNLEGTALSTAQPLINRIYNSLPPDKQKEIHKDARVAVFANLAAVLRTVKLANIFKVEYMDDMDWYLNIYIGKYNQQTSMISPNGIGITGVPKDIYKKDLDQVMLLTLVHCSFSAIESCLRTFVKTLDPTSCDNGAAEFQSIYDHLLKILSMNQYKSLLDIFRLVRNTIHNNGVYIHKTKHSDSVTYNKRSYTFVQNVAPDYGDAYELMIRNIIPNVIQMLNDIINSTQIASLTFVEDPIWNSVP